jgi:D-serine deaminase-like pyridoxal phosphate-dependent protein
MGMEDDHVESMVIGLRKEELDTPVLLVDLDRLERNINRTAAFFRDRGVGWRPHSKGHKIPALAHLELAAGALGIICAKLGEAEVMAAAGVTGIMIANEIVGPIKTRRLAALCRRSPVIVAVDCIENVRDLAHAAQEAGSTIGVVVEVDTGSGRAGAQPGQPALDLASEASRLSGLRFMGIMGWEGHTRRIKDPVPRKAAIEKAVGQLVDTAQLCRDNGIPVEIVSCGGTGTEEFSSLVPGVTEIQAGGIVFNDVFYTELGVTTEPALTVLSTVTSRPAPRTVTTDAGKKTMSMDVALPRPLGLEAVSVRLSAEHATIELKEPSSLRVGDQVEWFVGYADTTVHLHDEVHCIRNGRVEAVWPVAGRGRIR